MSTRANIVINQGSDFSVPITLTDINGEALNVTNFTANSCMRTYYNSSNAIPFTTSLANGCLTLSMSAADTGNISSGRYVYDVVLTDTISNTVSRLVEGICTVSAGVTGVEPTNPVIIGPSTIISTYVTQAENYADNAAANAFANAVSFIVNDLGDIDGGEF